TVSDHLKVGYGIEEDIDPSLTGIVDPKSNSKETVKLIGD
ncbi:MAG TPA: methyl-coenzyme M reductase operon protein D, partial [Methanobacterium subterraneum]|nr:methyl-coenzyme M reductase operon protein D [Methanobacterium subterraneum]